MALLETERTLGRKVESPARHAEETGDVRWKKSNATWQNIDVRTS